MADHTSLEPGRTPVRLGIDVGGTKCLALVVDDDGEVIDRRRVATPRGSSELAAALVDLVESFDRDPSSWRSIGLGVPGLVTPDGVIVSSPNLPGVENFGVGEVVSERLGRVVPVDNDANCAARAEWRVGAARGVDEALIVTLGTGIGGGVVIGGRLVRGAHGFAGEIGHMVIEAGGRLCACGRRGCWEQYASGTALRRLASEARERGVEWESSGDDAVDVRRAAEAGDRSALAIIDSFGDWIALGVATLCHVVDPDVVVIGGGVAHRADVVRDAVERHVGDHLYASHVRSSPEVRLARFGEDAGALGAAFLDASDPT